MMAAVRNKDSEAELLLRGALWRRGLRYRKHARLVGRPDLIFGPARVAVFVDGDFWHGNAWRLRGLPNLAAQFPHRTKWWVKKITRNVERDAEVTAELRRRGWKVLRFWESRVLKAPDRIAARVAAVVKERRR
jgi:DNA mismatch endonuclease (patch repair protein)